MVKTLEDSSKADVSSLLAAAGKETIGEKFLKQLESLSTMLETGNCLFVRCIKPNPAMRPGEVNRSLCLEQLTCGGVVKALEMRSAGFPDRLEYKEFLQEFAILENSGRVTGAVLIEPQERVKKLLEIFVGEADEGDDPVYANGTTKVFMKAGVLSRMRRFIILRRFRFTILVQRKWRLKRGIQMIHEIEVAVETFEALEENEFADVRSLAEKLKEAEKEIRFVSKALEDSRAKHGSSSPRKQQSLVGAEMGSQHAARISKLPKILSTVSKEAERIKERKEKAVAKLYEVIQEASKTLQGYQAKLDELEQKCASSGGGESSKEQDAVTSSIGAARTKIDEILRKQLPELETQGPAGLDLNSDGDIPNPAPGLEGVLNSARDLLKTAEAAMAQLMKARFGFDTMCKVEMERLDKARKALEGLQTESKSLIADGFNGVGEVLQSAWQLETECTELQRAAVDADAFKAKVAALEKAQAEAEEQVEAGKKYQERRRQEAEKARREKEKQEMEQLVSVVTDLKTKEKMTFAGRSFAKVLEEAMLEVKSNPAASQLLEKLKQAQDALDVLGTVFDFDAEPQGLEPVGPAHGAGVWSVDCTAALEKVEESDFAKAKLLPKDQCSSIRQAVEGLNAKVFRADIGYCIVYSSNRDSYFLLYRKDCKQLALDEFNLEDESDED
jgi:myosin heavy subunit